MGLLDLLLPVRCAGCRAEGAMLCADCRQSLLPLGQPLCARCGAPVSWPVERCRECAGRRLAFARARAAVAYEGVGTRVVSAWKQGGRRTLAGELAEIVTGTVPAPPADAVAFVPPVRARELWRGHNPSEGLARELGGAWSLPVLALLTRADGRPQRGLAPSERRRNVAGAFAAAGRSPPEVVLVDDVYTTGATVSAAAAALRRGGATRVEVVTFARTLRGGGSGIPRR